MTVFFLKCTYIRLTHCPPHMCCGVAVLLQCRKYTWLKLLSYPGAIPNSLPLIYIHVYACISYCIISILSFFVVNHSLSFSPQSTVLGSPSRGCLLLDSLPSLPNSFSSSCSNCNSPKSTSRTLGIWQRAHVTRPLELW